MNDELDSNKMLQVLDWAYEKSLNGIPGGLSATELGEEYLRKNNYDVIKASNNLINWQVNKCATSGFICGLGGLITMPVSIPANITSVIYVQIRMIAAIAYIGKCDLKDDYVKTLVYMCLTGNAAIEMAKEMGIKLGVKLTETLIKKISGQTLFKINKAVGFRLVTKFGQKGVVNLGKTIPLIGGIIGGGVDFASTKVIGKVSKKIFIA